MKEKKGKEFNTWYATQVEKNELYELWEELNKYCHSDIMVWKAACYKFIQEFKEEARINPMEKCATIASACNLFWRQVFISEDTIAIEALNGWRGNQENQSKVALVQTLHCETCFNRSPSGFAGLLNRPQLFKRWTALFT